MPPSAVGFPHCAGSGEGLFLNEKTVIFVLSKTAGTPYRVQVFFTSGNIKKPIKGTNFRHIEKRELVFNVLTVDTMVLGFKKNKDKQHYHIGLKIVTAANVLRQYTP